MIKFDTTEIDDSKIVGLRRKHLLFPNGSAFCFGQTPMAKYEIDILDSTYSIPEKVTINVENSNREAFISAVSTEDDVTTYECLDAMCKFNFYYQRSENANTLAEILTDICTQAGVTLTSTNFNGASLTYSEGVGDGVLARTLVGYIAELNGGYANITRNNQLYINRFSQGFSDSVNLNTFSSFKIGQKQKVSRIIYDDGEQYFVAGDETGTTVYLDTRNIFINYQNVQTMVNDIYALAKDFEFYNVEATDYYGLRTVDAGNTLRIQDGSNNYYTIIQYDDEYMGAWYGDLEVDINEATQSAVAEAGLTTIIKGTMKDIVTTIDRDLNQIRTDISECVQTSDDDYQTLVTSIIKDIEGIKIQKSNSETYMHVGNDAVEIVNNGRVTQAMSDGQFVSGEWVIGEYNGGQGLAIFRRGN